MFDLRSFRPRKDDSAGAIRVLLKAAQDWLLNDRAAGLRGSALRVSLVGEQKTHLPVSFWRWVLEEVPGFGLRPLASLRQNTRTPWYSDNRQRYVRSFAGSDSYWR
jgi:hypothetical protein